MKLVLEIGIKFYQGKPQNEILITPHPEIGSLRTFGHTLPQYRSFTPANFIQIAVRFAKRRQENYLDAYKI